MSVREDDLAKANFLLSPEVLHKLCEDAHLRQDRWFTYFRSQLEDKKVYFRLPSGAPVFFHALPREKYKRWLRQIETNYSDLPTEETKSDRKIALRTISSLKALTEEKVVLEFLDSSPVLEALARTAHDIWALEQTWIHGALTSDRWAKVLLPARFVDSCLNVGPPFAITRQMRGNAYRNLSVLCRFVSIDVNKIEGQSPASPSS